MRPAVKIALMLGVLALSALGCGLLNPTTPPPAATLPPTAAPSPTPEDPAAGQTARVVTVIDGDTIDVLIDGERYRVRYIGINTPEREEVCYAEATAANAAWVEDRTVRLVRDVSETDRYGRLLRYVYVDGVFVNEALIRDGWAEAVSFPPDTTYVRRFYALEDQARAAGLGCHPTGVFD